MEEKGKIVCILGRTCSGKDTLTTNSYNKLTELYNNDNPYEFVVSYTTRPIREKETNGVEHIFISEEEYENKYKDMEKFAYTIINGYHYFTLVDQVINIIENGKIPIYIIDFSGLMNLYDKLADKINCDVYTIYITADTEVRRTRFVSRQFADFTGKIPTKYLNMFYDRESSELKSFDMYEKNIIFKPANPYQPNIVINNSKEEFYNININIIATALDNFYKS